MDNSQIPPVQPVAMGNATMVGAVGPKPTITAAQPKKSPATLILGIFVALFVILTGIFAGLFVVKNNDYKNLSEDIDLKIAAAVSQAKTDQMMEDAEEAKKDTRQFTGPTDYGQLSFDFPKLWSVYIESDASKGGNFTAYLNPLEIEPVTSSTVYALRVSVVDKDFEGVVAGYQQYVTKGTLNMSTIQIGGATANKYVGTIPGTELNGIIVIFKIRDKTAVLRTDSMGYESDFQKILDSVKFNA
jgi:hypothetical protein